MTLLDGRVGEGTLVARTDHFEISGVHLDGYQIDGFSEVESVRGWVAPRSRST